MLRAIAAVVAGYFSIVLVLFPSFTAIYLTIGADGAFQPGKYEISTLWYLCAIVVNGLGAIAGGWVCAKIAGRPRPPQVLAGILLGLGLLLGIGKLFGPADTRPTERDGSVGNLEAMQNAREPISFAFLTPFIGFGGALLGGRLARRKDESNGDASTGGASSGSSVPTAAWLLIASGAATLFAPAHSAAAGADDVYFETQIRPILKARCWHCHGEEPELAGKLDLRLARKIATGGESGPAFVAGKPAESLLWQRIEKGEMPPGDKKLSRSELDLLRRWIEQGARTARPEPQTDLPPGAFSDEERSHWAFQPVAAPTVPPVTRTDSLRSPIDSFVQQQLEPLGATLAAPAERAVLLRRLSLDLVGLPPSPEDAAEFQADSAPDAYARAVDRLIASPRYGERWGRH
ncbi:MAG TPA: DUF1549 domain-containing protein, partial [Pirellulaceae bacterium]|nr:DUF1549 domain-containing protein [Pirellulaceae bacterium]